MTEVLKIRNEDDLVIKSFTINGSFDDLLIENAHKYGVDFDFRLVKNVVIDNTEGIDRTTQGVKRDIIFTDTERRVIKSTRPLNQIEIDKQTARDARKADREALRPFMTSLESIADNQTIVNSGNNVAQTQKNKDNIKAMATGILKLMRGKGLDR